MKSFYEIILEEAKERGKYLENSLNYAVEIKRRAKELFNDAKVIVFSSVVKSNYKPMSNVDVLIISEHIPENIMEQAKIKIFLTENFKPGVFPNLSCYTGLLQRIEI